MRPLLDFEAPTTNDPKRKVAAPVWAAAMQRERSVAKPGLAVSVGQRQNFIGARKREFLIIQLEVRSDSNLALE